MRRVVVGCLIAMTVAGAALAADDTGAMLDRALDDLAKNGYEGDTSSAERYLQAILEQHPDHLEARWQLLYLHIASVQDESLLDRATGLASISPEINRLVALAKKSHQTAFAHFMTAVHASYYKDYERALREIGQALALEPKSARYLTWKGRLEVEHGRWTRSDAELGKGIGTLKAARELARTHPSHFLRDENFEYTLAQDLSFLSQPPWQEVTEHYERFLENAGETPLRVYALNNVSSAYSKLGQCDKAKAAAEKALSIRKFSAAEFNKRYAEFCLEMAKSDPAAKP